MAATSGDLGEKEVQRRLVTLSSFVGRVTGSERLNGRLLTTGKLVGSWQCLLRAVGGVVAGNGAGFAGQQSGRDYSSN